MKETVEVVKCDLCGVIIDTDNIPEDEYHYKYHILRPNHDCIDTLEKDICPTCASKINKIYNGKHGEDINKYMGNYIDSVFSELFNNNGVKYADNGMITVSHTQLRSLMKKVFLDSKE